MKSEYTEINITHIDGCSFIQQKNTSGFIVKETSFSHYIKYAGLYRGHNYSSSNQDECYTQEQFFALADFLNDNLNTKNYYLNSIHKEMFLLLWNACSGLTPDRLEKRGYWKPEFYKSSFTYSNNCGVYNYRGNNYDVIKLKFNDKKISIIESCKEVTRYCKNKNQFTINVTYEDFYCFMAFIQLSLLVHLKEYAQKASISIIKEEPHVLINKAITMNILK